MSQNVFTPPPNNSMPLNTGDAPERGVSPKGLVDGINANFTELYTFAASRPLGTTALLGDSRVAQIYSSQTILSGSLVPPSLAGYNHFNWGNARSGHRLKPVYNGGLSGDRSDQMLARVANVLAAKAGHLYMEIGVNDISQAQAGYTTVNAVGPNQGAAVTTANVAAIVFANIQYAVQQFMANGGRIVTIVLESGSEAFNTAQIAACIELNESIREFAESSTGVLTFDKWTSMHDPNLSTTTTIRFKANYAQEVSGSGVHEGNLGGYMVGKDFATYINANFPALSYLPGDVNEVNTLSTRNQLVNPLFVTATGGTLGAGASGTVPGSWTADRSGGAGTQTVAVSVGTPADGSPGKETIMACTFAGAGDLIRLRQDAVNANWNVGDIVEGMASVVVDAGATSLAGVFLDMQQNDGVITNDIRDLLPFNNSPIGTDGCTLFLRTPPFVITGKSGAPFLTMRLYAQGSGAGTATVRWRTAQIRKRNAI